MRMSQTLLIVLVLGMGTVTTNSPGEVNEAGATGESQFTLTDQYLGTSIRREVTDPPRGLYDLQPSILCDPEADPHRRLFKMWWFGAHPDPGEGPGDRIYYSQSLDQSGNTWDAPQVVLEPQLGATERDEADDHLLGSPTVLKIEGKYYMFYEAYGTYATVVNRFYSNDRRDYWTTHGSPEKTFDVNGILRTDWNDSYKSGRDVLGFAPRYKKAGTHPVYAFEKTYNDGKKYNRFLRLSKDDPDVADAYPLNQGHPVFWLYDKKEPDAVYYSTIPSANPANYNRKPLYSFWDGAELDTFVSTRADGEGIPGVMPDFVDQNDSTNLLGYVAESLDSEDMIGSLQNRVMLATSSDGIHWQRFLGGARGGAVLAPLNELTSLEGFENDFRCPGEGWDIHRAYGSGYPAALERDGFLELYFTDDTVGFRNTAVCPRPIIQWRMRFPIGDIEDPQAYKNAHRQNLDPDGVSVFYGEDIKWSPMYQRYFVATFGGAHARLAWSDLNPDPNQPPTFPRYPSSSEDSGKILPSNRFDATGIGNSRVGIRGGIISDGLGHTLECLDSSTSRPYTALDLYYEALPTDKLNDTAVHYIDLDHSFIVAWANDVFLQDKIIQTGQEASYNVPNSITAGDDTHIFTVENGGNVTFTAGARITLKPGFTAQKGSHFHASIDPNLQ
jgi:hypothetical protein